MSGLTHPNLPDLEEHASHHVAQMRPFGLSGIAERQEEQEGVDGLGQELVLPDGTGDTVGSGQLLSDESGLKPTTSQKGTILYYIKDNSKIFMHNKTLLYK